MKFIMTISRWGSLLFGFALSVACFLASVFTVCADELDDRFVRPPDEAKPRVLWMWMGSAITESGITRDLEALRDAGFGGATLFSLSDVSSNKRADIDNSPTPEVVTWTEPWWKRMRHAVQECKRLGLEIGLHNCAGYSGSGGPWVPPELSMQELCWSKTPVAGGIKVALEVPRPTVDPCSVMLWPIYNSDLKKSENPVIEARKTYYKDIAVLAAPATGMVDKAQIINLTEKMKPDGRLEWDAPAGSWTLYRFGHTTMGAMLYPAQWKAQGLECDKMNPEAVAFHINHVIKDVKAHLGDLAGTVLTHLHSDSWEQRDATWTPAMREEFSKRRNYDLTPFLLTFAKRTVGNDKATEQFKNDFNRTIKDLYRDVYFATLSRLIHGAGMELMCEPYGGNYPWQVSEVVPYLDRVTVEFWNDGGRFRPYQMEPVIAAAHQSGKKIIDAEAFTGEPKNCQWNEYPGQLKTAGDAAYCAGVNRFIVHRFAHQPWDDRYKPGMTMGQWGTHFDRTQTWWSYIKGLALYWQRCQALLQWGTFVGERGSFKIESVNSGDSPKPRLQYIQRRDEGRDVFFVANVDPEGQGVATCSFAVTGRQPELWDPITGARRDLTGFSQVAGRTTIPIRFEPTRSYFIVFRKPVAAPAKPDARNFPDLVEAATLSGAWQVSFDPQWGGPQSPATFETLQDWITRPEAGIKYYSGTATYRKVFDLAKEIRDPKSDVSKTSDLRPLTSGLWLDLGAVKYVARVRLNGRELGEIWTAPWRVEIPAGFLKEKGNQLEIDVANVWANRLIGDEQETCDVEWTGSQIMAYPDWLVKGEPRPSKGRYCFSSWRYSNKNSPLVSSGLLGPARVLAETKLSFQTERVGYNDRE